MTTLVVDLQRAGADRTARMAVRGEVDLDTADSLERAVESLLADGPAVVAIDFSGVSFCDSSGIRALMRAYTLAAERGCRVELHRVDPDVRRVFDLVGLSDRLIAPL